MGLPFKVLILGTDKALLVLLVKGTLRCERRDFGGGGGGGGGGASGLRLASF